jgi:deazaflavin-dependent oxidoreductase (nitroreductase family)
MTAENELASAAATAPEVDLTTFGRKSGRPSRNTIWITTDAHGRIHIRSGQGLVRDWPQNLLANGRAILHIDGKDVPVQARHVTDRAELLASRDAVKAKYGRELPTSQPGQPPTPPEQATFEIVPAAQAS